MPDLLVSDIPDAVFPELQARALKAGCSLEDYAKGLICDAVAKLWHMQDADITLAQLGDNTEAILGIAEREPVFVVDDDGQRLVLLSADEYGRIAKPDDTQG